MSSPTKVLSQILLSPKGELTFTIPSDASLLKKTGIPATLNISNPTNEVVMFKVKTTAPKKYCVKPNSGELKAGGNVDVQVMLQPVLSKDKKTPEYPKKSDPPCKDKFLVQSVLRSFVRDDDALWESRNNSKETTLWKKVPTIMEDKMKCAFNFTAAAGAAAAATPAAEARAPSITPPAAVNKVAPAVAPARTEPPVAVAAEKVAAPVAKKPAASKPSSPEPQEAKPAKSAAVATPARSKTVASSSKTSTKVATIGDTPAEAKARIVLLFAAFIIGVLMGKYVL